MKTIALSLFALIIPSFLVGQMSFDEIKDKTIELRERFMNKEFMEQRIVEERNKYFDPNLRQNIEKDTGGIAGTLTYLYLQTNQFDSAFHYLEISQKLKGGYGFLSLGALLRVFNDPRYEVYLYNKFDNAVGVNNLGIRVHRNTDFTREVYKLRALQWSIREVFRMSDNDPLGTQEEARQLSKDFTAYKLERYRKHLENSGLPTYSEHGYEASNDFYAFLKGSSPDILIEYIYEIEELALAGELIGSWIGNMVDQKLVKEGEKQRYGTACTFEVEESIYVPFPIEDERNVEKRRKKIGLDFDLKTYYDQMNSKLH